MSVINLEELKVDEFFQTRKATGLNQERVSLLADVALQRFEEDGEYPFDDPIVVAKFNTGKLTLIAGFHRVPALAKAGYRQAEATIVESPSREAAYDLALEFNQHDGLPLSNADTKANIIYYATERGETTSSNIAAKIGCTDRWVRKVLKEHTGLSAKERRSEAIKKARKANPDATQTEIAKKAKVSTRTVQRCQNGTDSVLSPPPPKIYAEGYQTATVPDFSELKNPSESDQREAEETEDEEGREDIKQVLFHDLIEFPELFFTSITDAALLEFEKAIIRYADERLNRPTKKKFKAPSLAEIIQFIQENGVLHVDADDFFNHFNSVGWMIGAGKKMNCWQSAIKAWNSRERKKKGISKESEEPSQSKPDIAPPPVDENWLKEG